LWERKTTRTLVAGSALEPGHRASELARFLAKPGDHLGHEPEPEEGDAADDHGFDEVEQGAEPDAVAEAEHEGDDPGQESDAEQPGPEQSEEQHRLPAESELEPHREQVEHPHRNSGPAELRHARAPGVQRHGMRGQAPAVRGGDDHHEPVPVGAQRHGRHDLPPPRLHRIEVLYLHAEQPPAERVVHAAHERFLVFALLRAGDDVRGAVENRPDERGHVFREVLQIGRVEHEHIARRGIGGAAQGIGDAALPPMRHDPQEGILGAELVEHRPGVVTGTIVDDDDFIAESGRSERRRALADELRQVLRLVLGGNQQAHVDRGGHTRLRMRAGRMPS
jgi:hypothetical protein